MWRQESPGSDWGFFVFGRNRSSSAIISQTAESQLRGGAHAAPMDLAFPSRARYALSKGIGSPALQRMDPQ